tara:strand:+ start:1040 stop:1312 length:273 start_codon:yes stop_codon:yes gene_type:complete
MARLKHLSIGITLLILLVAFTSFNANGHLIKLQNYYSKTGKKLSKKQRKMTINSLESSINFVVFLFVCISITTYLYTSKIATLLAEVENV